MKSKTFLLILVFILLAVPACTVKPPSLYNSAWVTNRTEWQASRNFPARVFFRPEF